MNEQEWEDKLAEVQKNSEHWYNKYKDAEKRNTELKNQNRLLGERCNQLLKDKGNLTDELAKWKEEWQEQVQKAIDEGWERTKLTGRVRELEKENEELKEKCNTLDKSLVTSTKNNIERQKIIDGLKEEDAVLEKRIERAKEIIRWFVVYEKGEGIITNYNIFLEQAEKFIKEIEK